MVRLGADITAGNRPVGVVDREGIVSLELLELLLFLSLSWALNCDSTLDLNSSVLEDKGLFFEREPIAVRVSLLEP